MLETACEYIKELREIRTEYGPMKSSKLKLGTDVVFYRSFSLDVIAAVLVYRNNRFLIGFCYYVHQHADRQVLLGLKRKPFITVFTVLDIFICFTVVAIEMNAIKSEIKAFCLFFFQSKKWPNCEAK